MTGSGGIAPTGAPAPGSAPDVAPTLGFAAVLQRLAEGRDLTREEAARALHQIVEGSAGEAQAAAFLMALRVKGETSEEIAGLLETMRGLAIPVETSGRDVLVDIVGTGGDRLGTFNISTTAALVVAGAGVKVAKHGNRAASSLCGSADLLEALGVRVDLTPAEVAACLERVGMGFMMAPLHHPAMGRVAAVRRALGVRTVFNFLGPLTNPAGVRRQLVGVGAADYLEVLAGALARVGCEHALLVHGAEGMDELSVAGPSMVVEVRDGEVGAPYRLDPEECGLRVHDLAALLGGDPTENAAITRRVLAGVGGAPRDAVLLNAAAALYVAGVAPSILEGVEVAAESIDSGLAARLLDQLVSVTNEPAAKRR
jgi:anthranilate phosphoribosyltransferase